MSTGTSAASLAYISSTNSSANASKISRNPSVSSSAQSASQSWTRKDTQIPSVQKTTRERGCSVPSSDKIASTSNSIAKGSTSQNSISRGKRSREAVAAEDQATTRSWNKNNTSGSLRSSMSLSASSSRPSSTASSQRQSLVLSPDETAASAAEKNVSTNRDKSDSPHLSNNTSSTMKSRPPSNERKHLPPASPSALKTSGLSQKIPSSPHSNVLSSRRDTPTRQEVAKQDGTQERLIVSKLSESRGISSSLERRRSLASNRISAPSMSTSMRSKPSSGDSNHSLETTKTIPLSNTTTSSPASSSSPSSSASISANRGSLAHKPPSQTAKLQSIMEADPQLSQSGANSRNTLTTKESKRVVSGQVSSKGRDNESIPGLASEALPSASSEQYPRNSVIKSTLHGGSDTQQSSKPSEFSPLLSGGVDFSLPTGVSKAGVPPKPKRSVKLTSSVVLTNKDTTTKLGEPPAKRVVSCGKSDELKPRVLGMLPYAKMSETNLATTSSENTLTKRTTPTRKRGKTLPSSQPAPIRSLALPPMKLLPLEANLAPERKTSPNRSPVPGKIPSPTKIPIPSRTRADDESPTKKESDESPPNSRGTRLPLPSSMTRQPSEANTTTTTPTQRDADFPVASLSSSVFQPSTGPKPVSSKPRATSYNFSKSPSSISNRKTLAAPPLITKAKPSLNTTDPPPQPSDSNALPRTRKISQSSIPTLLGRALTDPRPVVGTRRDPLALQDVSPIKPSHLNPRDQNVSLPSPSKPPSLSTLVSSTRQLESLAANPSSASILEKPPAWPTEKPAHLSLSSSTLTKSSTLPSLSSSGDLASPKDTRSETLKEPRSRGAGFALSPQTAVKVYAKHLSVYEITEILEFPQIYYVGQGSPKKMATREQTTNNYGYDDEKGDYQITVQDHLGYRYEVKDSLGKGSFGQVARCFDHKTGEVVAVKIIRNKKRFHCQAQVEIRILEQINKWDPDDEHNCVRMTDHFQFRNHLCIVFECLSINLYEFIKGNNFQGSTPNLIKKFTHQLLKALSLLYKHQVVHCDLKPENVLLKDPTKTGIKMIDFGSSCFENERVYTYIQSRFYRSPEVILGMSYNMAIDMWSLGCILAELLTGYPLFPGENEQDQLACIMEINGVPDQHLVEKSSRRKLFFDSTGSPRLYTSTKGKKRRPGTRTLQQALKCQDAHFVDFIAQCLIWDPEKRMTPGEAMSHSWLIEIRPSLSATRGDLHLPDTFRRKATISSSRQISIPSTKRSEEDKTEVMQSKSIGSAPTATTITSSTATITTAAVTGKKFMQDTQSSVARMRAQLSNLDRDKKR
ncbi:uncharacterized protein VTP21DRAFT_1956 [Calcarisporiella thermophila]|uniref:uncharacterized protein n=1 Tax=Calcarisporiella thermophila TaxID=911321 RepID=UPI0037425785